MKENIDIISALAGGSGAFIKGRKKKRPVKTLILDVVVGVILGYTTIGLLDYFTSELNPKTIMLVSFSVGWVANELTDVLEKLVVKSYDIIVGKLTKEDQNKKEKEQ